ncbi:hypothetical protein CLOBOL_01719 [Enterocloster bolteae ATCC BAA-613]|uniref:Uncharacterized protein n=1 Tax=Enterocloster bolteae (strain ATCC BAA-613 / DSM 15670 / CCUG 46953 / JCM 12243 / WAL 16351) TaxID=411902 RepID=A8RLS1_ENTBW|nr:hypothetical protein CLOBOL_01719 [Enterocloster bolteae ATCC BAA-613]
MLKTLLAGDIIVSAESRCTYSRNRTRYRVFDVDLINMR